MLILDLVRRLHLACGEVFLEMSPVDFERRRPLNIVDDTLDKS